MKKIILALFLSLCVFSFQAQAAQVGVYIAPKMGLNFQGKGDAKVSSSTTSSGLSADRTSSLNAGIALGYDLQYATTLPMRFEFEAMFRTSTTADNTWTFSGSQFSADQEIGMTTYFVNAYYDFYTSTPFTPYLAAGLGFANVEHEFNMNGIRSSKSSSEVAFNIGAGVSWLLAGDFTLDLGYRYIYPDKVKNTFTSNGVSYTSSIRPTTHELNCALRYTF